LNGDTSWTKTYYVDVPYSTSDQASNTAIQTTDGGYLILGNAQNWVEGMYHTVLIKTNSFGDTLWSKCYTGRIDRQGNSIAQTFDGGYIIGGTSLIKTDTNGNGGCLNEQFSLHVVLQPVTISSHATTLNSGCIVSNPSKPNSAIGATVLTECSTTAISELERNNSINVFPNPVTDNLIIQLDNQKYFEFLLTNALGEVIYKKLVSGNQSEINLSTLKQGVYFYNVNTRKDEWNGKLIKE
jgi:hypothetical protein